MRLLGVRDVIVASHVTGRRNAHASSLYTSCRRRHRRRGRRHDGRVELRGRCCGRQERTQKLQVSACNRVSQHPDACMGRLKTQVRKTKVRICNGGKRKHSNLKSILKSLRFSTLTLAFAVDPLSVGLDQFTCTVPDR